MQGILALKFDHFATVFSYFILFLQCFMKGQPSNPRCGFSRQMIALLDESGVPYDSFNILEDNEVRQGLKEFSNWPTYPQLYVKGELIGGLDICKELAEDGDLIEILNQKK